MPRAAQLGGGTAGFLCPESAGFVAASLTRLCFPETSETAEAVSFLLLEKTPHLPPFTAAVLFF